MSLTNHIETITEDFELSLLGIQNVFSRKTDFGQHLLIGNHGTFGRTLFLDGKLMTCEFDEHIYHEVMVHIPMQSLLNPRRVLVIGGGDLGILKELAKYPELTEIIVCEIDKEVVDISKEYLFAIHEDAYKDPRIEFVYADGYEYARTCSKMFDLIIMDLPDPDGNCSKLYTKEAFDLLKRSIRGHGIVACHAGSPYMHVDRVTEIYATLQAVFCVVNPYMTNIPSYSGAWMFMFASPYRTVDISNTKSKRLDSIERTTLHYDRNIHEAGLKIPKYVLPLSRK